MRGLWISALILVLASSAVAQMPSSTAGSPLARINHFIIIFQENWSFDGLFGKFPGANGLANAGATVRQVDKNGQPYTVLPQPIDGRLKPPGPDPRFPANLPVEPFNLAQFVLPTETTGDLIHKFYREQYQINGGKMDKFVAWSDAGGLVMSYYDATNWPVGRLAQQFVLADNFFHAAFGDSFLNHMWLICACTPTWPDAPAGMRVQLDAAGIEVKAGTVTPDGFILHTAYSINTPHPASIADPKQLVPNQTLPTIGDRLSEQGISWAWYAQGFKEAVAGSPHPDFKFHHQPFVFFTNQADGTRAKADHLRDEVDFLADLARGQLPAVSFVKFMGTYNEHPNQILMAGMERVAQTVRAVMNSSVWDDVAIIITYDENGGRWDHVAPPKIDKWGPGTRVPAIIISPHAKRRFVDHTLYDTTSILRTIERRWNLRPLGTRDGAANDLSNAFAP